jgi:hypothetical protein
MKATSKRTVSKMSESAVPPYKNWTFNRNQRRDDQLLDHLVRAAAATGMTPNIFAVFMFDDQFHHRRLLDGHPGLAP